MIFQKNDPSSNKQLFQYAEILNVEIVEDDYNGSAVRPRWSFRFRLEMQHRTFDLYAASEDERTLWTFVFNWIIGNYSAIFINISVSSVISAISIDVISHNVNM